MIFVDTSVWIAAFRDGEGREARHLSTLLDADSVALAGPVRIEILSGAARAERTRLRRLLSALPLFYPEEGEWQRIDDWVERAGEAGDRFGFADLLIAAIAAGNSGALWSLDGDFERMVALGFLSLHRPPQAG